MKAVSLTRSGICRRRRVSGDVVVDGSRQAVFFVVDGAVLAELTNCRFRVRDGSDGNSSYAVLDLDTSSTKRLRTNMD